MSVESNSGALAPRHESTAQRAADFIQQLGNSQLFIEAAKHGAPWPLAKPREGGLLQRSEVLIDALNMPLQQALINRNMLDDGSTIETLALLADNKPAFVEIEENKLAPIIEIARLMFDADRKGFALRTKLINDPDHMGKTHSFLYGIPALEKGGVTYRLLITPGEDKMPMLRSAFGLLALPTKFATTAGATLAITEMVPDAEQPTDFTEAEIDEWLSRVEAAGVELNINDFRQTEFLSETEVEDMLARIRAAGFKLDADKLRQSTEEDNNDKGLDNFLRVDGKLYWCDGDLMLTHEIDAKAMALQIEKWRELMRSFVRPELPQAA
jgi:hypothetical protein